MPALESLEPAIMHFNILASFLLSTALTSLVTSAPVDVDAGVSVPDIARRDNGAWEIKAKDATWEAYAKFCGGRNSKRGLEKRAPQAPISPGSVVDQGKKDKMIGIPLGLWTWNLKTCIGVVVVGKTKKG